jgi:hypothetical protein
MIFYGFRIIFDGKEVGNMITPTEDPKKAAQEWLDKIPDLISIPIRKAIENEPGLLIAERERGSA